MTTTTTTGATMFEDVPTTTCPVCQRNILVASLPTGKCVVCTMRAEQLATEHRSNVGAHFPYEVKHCPSCESVTQSIFANSCI